MNAFEATKEQASLLDVCANEGNYHSQSWETDVATAVSDSGVELWEEGADSVHENWTVQLA